MARIVEGRKAPEFSLSDATGQRVAPSDFRGRDVVVYFYPKDDTAKFAEKYKLPFPLLSDPNRKVMEA